MSPTKPGTKTRGAWTRAVVRRTRGQAGLRVRLILAPPTGWMVFFLLIPMGLVFLYGLAWVDENWTTQLFPPTLSNFARVLSPNWVVIPLLFKTFAVAGVQTLLSLIVGYAIAYYIARLAKESRRGVLMSLIVIPFWVSFVVRVYGLFAFSTEQGFVAVWLKSNGLGFLAEFMIRALEVGTFHMLAFTLMYVWIPFMILPLYTSLSKIDPQLLEAAYDLGASRMRAFFRVTLPLSFPGIVAGSILTFITSVGSFVEPTMVGGTDWLLVGNYVVGQFEAAAGLPEGAAAAVLLMVSTLLLIMVYTRYAEAQETGELRKSKLWAWVKSILAPSRAPRPAKPPMPARLPGLPSVPDAPKAPQSSGYQPNGGVPEQERGGEEAADSIGNPRPTPPPAAAWFAGDPSSADPRTLKDLDNTRGGLELLLFGAALAWIPPIRPIGWSLAILGAGLVALGRSAGGRAHSHSALLWARVYLLLAVGVPLVQFMAGLAPSYIENPAPMAPLIPAYLILFGLVAGMALAAGPASVFLTHGIQEPFERKLLWLGFLTLTGLVAAQTLASVLSLLFEASPSDLRAQLGLLDLLFVVPSVFFAIPYFRVWARIRRPSLMERVFDPLVEKFGKGVLAAITFATILVLFVPLILVAVFSFNAAEDSFGSWRGFSLVWYLGGGTGALERTGLFGDKEVMDALANSIIVGLGSAVLALVFGMMAAYAMDRFRFRFKESLRSVMYLGLVIPSIVLGVSIAILIRFLNDYFLNPVGYAFLGTSLEWERGLLTILVGHTTFNIPLATLVLLISFREFDRSLEEAAMDLGADELTTFFKVTIPNIVPGIISALLLAFTFSFDELPVTIFLSGEGVTTIPVVIWGMISRKWLTPKVNAASTLILVMSVIFVIAANKIQKGGKIFRI